MRWEKGESKCNMTQILILADLEQVSANLCCKGSDDNNNNNNNNNNNIKAFGAIGALPQLLNSATVAQKQT